MNARTAKTTSVSHPSSSGTPRPYEHLNARCFSLFLFSINATREPIGTIKFRVTRFIFCCLSCSDVGSD